jgi:hypothetical protein
MTLPQNIFGLCVLNHARAGGVKVVLNGEIRHENQNFAILGVKLGQKTNKF